MKKLPIAAALAAATVIAALPGAAAAQSRFSITIGNGYPGYYDAYGRYYDPYDGYNDPYYHRDARRAWIERQRWEERRRWEQRRYWEQRHRWEDRRWHRHHDDDDDD